MLRVLYARKRSSFEVLRTFSISISIDQDPFSLMDAWSMLPLPCSNNTKYSITNNYYVLNIIIAIIHTIAFLCPIIAVEKKASGVEWWAITKISTQTVTVMLKQCW